PMRLLILTALFVYALWYRQTRFDIGFCTPTNSPSSRKDLRTIRMDFSLHATQLTVLYDGRGVSMLSAPLLTPKCWIDCTFTRTTYSLLVTSELHSVSRWRKVSNP